MKHFINALNNFDANDLAEIIHKNFLFTAPKEIQLNFEDFVIQANLLLTHMRVLSTGITSKNDEKFEFHFILEIIDNSIDLHVRIPSLAKIECLDDLIKHVDLSFDAAEDEEAHIKRIYKDVI